MSGGAYDYLYSRVVEELEDREDTIQLMKTALENFEAGAKAALETERVLSLLKEIELLKQKVEEKVDELAPVWKAVEREENGDSSLDAVKKALEEYNAVQRLRS